MPHPLLEPRGRAVALHGQRAALVVPARMYGTVEIDPSAELQQLAQAAVSLTRLRPSPSSPFLVIRVLDGAVGI